MNALKWTGWLGAQMTLTETTNTRLSYKLL